METSWGQIQGSDKQSQKSLFSKKLEKFKSSLVQEIIMDDS